MIDAKLGQIDVADFAEVLEVSESGYYAWSKQERSFHEEQDERLGKGIAAVFEESRQTYGAQRVYHALRDRGIYSSRKRVARLMRQAGLGPTRNGSRIRPISRPKSAGSIS